MLTLPLQLACQNRDGFPARVARKWQNPRRLYTAGVDELHRHRANMQFLVAPGRPGAGFQA
ncbi:hypothetical protein [Xanthomonas fragariae]|uniref:hypothetical protein n=1 Tax=Xanthomonas fragariae TaxID=48664 RepID=UPI00039ECF67|nr:hypothetical protein [Xanthomonas fragariae]